MLFRVCENKILKLKKKNFSRTSAELCDWCSYNFAESKVLFNKFTFCYFEERTELSVLVAENA
jgi:hypothetical protein